jgi:energy-coupling factor transporter ATP-binding protein EcfA2
MDGAQMWPNPRRCARFAALGRRAAACRAKHPVLLKRGVSATLSGGWRRLLDVAVAFMGRPKLIVLDEPTNDLDPVHRRIIWDKLNALRGSSNVTCLRVTRDSGVERGLS